jgi:hypothetical protein
MSMATRGSVKWTRTHLPCTIGVIDFASCKKETCFTNALVVRYDPSKLLAIGWTGLVIIGGDPDVGVESEEEVGDKRAETVEDREDGDQGRSAHGDAQHAKHTDDRDEILPFFGECIPLG